MSVQIFNVAKTLLLLFLSITIKIRISNFLDKFIIEFCCSMPKVQYCQDRQ